VLEFAVEVGADFDGVVVDGGEQVADASIPAWAPGPPAATRRAMRPGGLCFDFGPGDAVVGLLVVALLLEIKDGKQDQGHCRDRQQRCYYPVI
jgi:hypothetical protein